MQKKHLDYTLNVESVNENGTFAGYASIFNVTDSQKDIMLKGAFANTLASGQDIKLLWQHHPDEPIGVLNLVREDEKGLYVEGKLLLDIQRGNESYTLLKSGAINGLSIGYTIKDYDIEPATGARLLKDVDLWEISLVTFPANTHAGITTIKGQNHHQQAEGDFKKNLPDTVRRFEVFLREAGFSRKSAKAIAIGGFKADTSQRDIEIEDEYVRASRAIDKAINILR